jgi:putative transposase
MARPALRRQAVNYLVDHYAASRRRACRVVRHTRSMLYYRSRKDPKTALRARLRELAQVRIRYGYRRLHVLLRREGWSLGKEQTYRLYTEESLQLRSKRPRRRKMFVGRRERYVPKRANQAWSMDFVADQLVNGTRFRALTIVDVFTREALAITVGQRLRAEQVVEVCNRIVARRGAPVRIFVDNGSEFSGRVFDLWAYHQKVAIDFSRPGKPTDNCFIETFNGSLRDECLNVHWFETIDEAKAKIEAWRVEYNESRPHQSLNELTPNEYALQNRSIRRSSDLQPAEG